MKPATAHSLLRAGLVVAFGSAAALLVFAWQARERVAELDVALGELETRFAAAGGSPNSEDDEAGSGDTQDRPGEADELAEAVRDRMAERYVFSQKPQERFRQVQGVLGNRVFFAGGRSVTVGESFDGVEVVRVDAEGIVVRRDGEEITVGVSGSNAGGASPPRNRRPGGRRSRR